MGLDEGVDEYRRVEGNEGSMQSGKMLRLASESSEIVVYACLKRWVSALL